MPGVSTERPHVTGAQSQRLLEPLVRIGVVGTRSDVATHHQHVAPDLGVNLGLLQPLIDQQGPLAQLTLAQGERCSAQRSGREIDAQCKGDAVLPCSVDASLHQIDLGTCNSCAGVARVQCQRLVEQCHGCGKIMPVLGRCCAHAQSAGGLSLCGSQRHQRCLGTRGQPHVAGLPRGSKKCIHGVKRGCCAACSRAGIAGRERFQYEVTALWNFQHRSRRLGVGAARQ